MENKARRTPIPNLLRLLALLYIISGLILLIIMINELRVPVHLGEVGILHICITAIAGLLMVVMGYGFLRSVRRCFWISIILISLLILAEAISITEGAPINIIELIVSIIILYFLTRSKIKIWFGIRPT